jgi:hypothetical protein
MIENDRRSAPHAGEIEVIRRVRFFSRHRWSFSLRTLFAVVTAVCLLSWWVVRQQRWVADRDDFVWTDSNPDDIALDISRVADPPWPLGYFGEQGYHGLVFTATAASGRVATARKLFPEAIVRRAAEPDLITGQQ